MDLVSSALPRPFCLRYASERTLSGVFMYIVDAAFTALKCVKSLPPRHGARWSAFIRNVCHTAELHPDLFFAGLVPLQHSQTPIMPGSVHLVRLLLTPEGAVALPVFFDAFSRTPVQGVFSSVTFGLSGFLDPFRQIRSGPSVLPFDMDLLQEEISLLRQCDHWSLAFDVPLRLPKPPTTRGPSHSERERYCDPAFFAALPTNLLLHLLIRLRFLPVPPLDFLPPTPVESRLTWEDMRYNSGRCISLGGVTGYILFSGAPDAKLAPLLVAGQYVGLGKNPRFGLGFYRIPELDDVRHVAMPQ